MKPLTYFLGDLGDLRDKLRCLNGVWRSDEISNRMVLSVYDGRLIWYTVTGRIYAKGAGLGLKILESNVPGLLYPKEYPVPPVLKGGYVEPVVQHLVNRLVIDYRSHGESYISINDESLSNVWGGIDHGLFPYLLDHPDTFEVLDEHGDLNTDVVGLVKRF